MDKQLFIEALNVFDSEEKSIRIVRDHLGDSFKAIFDVVSTTKGKVIFTGIGKPGHIAAKIAATFSSLGTPSFYLHPAEAQHGDLGMIQKKDIVIAISYSGESTEVTKIIPNIKLIGAKLIGITGNKESTLSKNSDITEVFPKFEEAGYLKLAPTCSTTVTLVYFDAMAIALAKYRNFDNSNFGLYHPAGAIGKKLLTKVNQLMVKGEENALVSENALLLDAVSEMCGKPIGLVNVVGKREELLGILTDGDIRRAIFKGKDIKTTFVHEIMTKNPVIVDADILVADALSVMVERKVQSVPVLRFGQVVGTLQLKDILKEGIFYD